MSTLAQLRQRVFDNLYSAEPQARPNQARLAGAVADTDADTSVTVDADHGIAKGDLIEFDDGEQGLVWAVSTNTLTVVRAQNGTASTAHDDNGFVKINPIHTIAQVDNALAEALQDMDGQGVYQLSAATDITLVAGTDLYELTETDFRPDKGVLSVFYQETSNSDLVGLPFLNFYDPFSGELTATLGVRLLWWGNNAATNTLSAVYAQSIVGKLGSITEPLIEEAAVLYATAKLLVVREGARLHDPGRYTDRTVQPGQGIRSGGYFQGQYQRLVYRVRAAVRQNEKNLPGAEFERARRFRR